LIFFEPVEYSGVRDAKIKGTITDEPHCVEVGINPNDPSAKRGFLVWIDDSVKQVFCTTGPGFCGVLPTAGAFVKLTGEYMGADFSFDEISVLSQPMPQTLKAIHEWNLSQRR
jgi:hypothetical protein